MVNYGVISSISAAKYCGILWQRPLLPSFLFFLGGSPAIFFKDEALAEARNQIDHLLLD